MVATLFVQIPNIEGDATEKAHLKWIVVDSVGFGITRHSEQEGGSVTRGFGKAVFDALELSSEVGSHTTPLMMASALGKSYTEILIDQCKSGSDEKAALVPYIKWKLKDALVQSYKVDGSAEDIPKESWSIKYGEVECEYYVTDPKTLKLTKKNDFKWDVGQGAMP